MRKLTLLLLSVFINFAALRAATVDFQVITNACSGAYTTLVASSSVPESLSPTYQWDWNNDNIYEPDYGKVINHIFNTAGTYMVKVKVIDINGAESFMTAKPVHVNPLPIADFRVDNSCEGMAAFFVCTATGASISQYKWDFFGNGSVDATGLTVSFNYGSAGSYATKLEVISDSGCTAVISKLVQIFPKPDAKFAVQNACIGELTTFTNQTTINNVLVYYWTFGDGQQSSETNPTHSFTGTGPFNTQLIAVSQNNCRDTFNLPVTLYPKPVVSLICTDTTLYANQNATITANGVFTYTNWSNQATTNTITVSNSGTYTVTVTDANGCKSSQSVHIEVKNIGDLLLESEILTPNGDGINEFLKVKDSEGYTSIKIVIFNIWGDKVYENENYTGDWSGNDFDAGTYYYSITTDKNDKKGSINILR